MIMSLQWKFKLQEFKSSQANCILLALNCQKKISGLKKKTSGWLTNLTAIRDIGKSSGCNRGILGISLCC